MSETIELRMLFEPLGNRLYLYESGQYLLNNPLGSEFEQDYPHELPFNYVTLLKEIETAANRFDPSDVYREATFYIGRVEKAKNNLVRRTDKFVWDGKEIIQVGDVDYPHIRKVALSKGEQEKLFQKWMEELDYIHEVLNRITFTRNHVTSKKEKESVVEIIQINLPEKLPIKKLQKYYNPYFSPIQAAQILQYLKDLQVIPPYGPTDLGRIGEFIFGRNAKSITEGLSSLENLKMTKDDFAQIQSVLSLIDKQINKDLKLINH